MKKGYYKLSRGWMNHNIFPSGEKFSEREAWIYFIEKASFAKHFTELKGKKTAVEVGSFFTTRSFMCSLFKWSEHQYRSFLERLVKEKMIEVDCTQGCTKVSLCNYDKYQSGSPTNHPYNNKGNNKYSKGDLKGSENYAFFRTQLISDYPSRATQLDVANTFRKLMSKIGKKSVCGNYVISEELFLQACRNYKEECRRNNVEPKFVKCPKTFVNGAFENYITAQSKEPKSGRKWTAF